MAPPDQVPVHDKAQPATTTANPNGKAKEDNPAMSTAELVGPTMAGPSSSNTSQPKPCPLLGHHHQRLIILIDLFFPNLM
ncbi:hypothetical protein EI94DRAFT_1815915 [Lactarius quietus]|nr:hypothetical protein EI94DRAFT_1815915 [Lactarius quietus]